jgi:benzoyl-CoA reductase/2-hydroxyglutaryl-CoA dehydratase subunit BcrC/BadD/HgdB
MKNILYSCPFIPAEWIAAHGFQPSRITPGIEGRGRPTDSGEGICPYVENLLNELKNEENSAAVCFTTVCDQMRRAAECFDGEKLPPVFIMHVPSTWETISSLKLYQTELKRLSSFLTRLGGEPPIKETLLHTMQIYDDRRNLLKNLKGYLSPRAFAEAIVRFNRTGEVIKSKEKSEFSVNGIPVALIGGPLTAQDMKLYDVINKAGGYVALDGTETGERTLPRPFQQKRMQENPFSELMDAYFGSIPDVFHRPNDKLYIWMEHEFSAHDVKGVILVRNVWCDLWHGEVRRIKNWLSIPLLDIDLNGHAPVLRNKTRLDAFLEILQ